MSKIAVVAHSGKSLGGSAFARTTSAPKIDVKLGRKDEIDGGNRTGVKSFDGRGPRAVSICVPDTRSC